MSRIIRILLSISLIYAVIRYERNWYSGIIFFLITVRLELDTYSKTIDLP